MNRNPSDSNIFPGHHSSKTSMMMSDFFKDEKLPPYLRTSNNEEEAARSGAGSSTQGLTEIAEGDLAGGSVLQRVSSFNILRAAQSPRPRIEKDEDKKPWSSPPKPMEMAPETPVAWRLKDRMKTVGVGLVMALNVGTDPPDITKPHPCAKLQCWMDPSSISRAKAKEKIGERLEHQYAQWQQKRATKALRYRRALDPTIEEVRTLCLGLRRQARNERVLLHYNGHGVPRPTANGEIWVFDKNHTQYIPLCVTDLRHWIGKPSIVVLDCSSAGILMPFLTAPLDASPPQTPNSTVAATDNTSQSATQCVRDMIVLAPTSNKEWLPMHPDYPADIFTSCLTTPIKVALRWFVRRNPQSTGGLDPDVVDAIPGKANDRKTPLGELNWIFTSVTDSIAWNILPKPLFQRLFRQDLLVASMFRNFLLADRILRSLNCSPQSYPPLPPGVCDHPLWQAWDLACETCLSGLMRSGVLGNHVQVTMQPDPENVVDEEKNEELVTEAPLQPVDVSTASSVTSPYFSEQLTAFEIWLEFASIEKVYRPNEPLDSPEQLPVVLQVLMSQAHRVRALTSLRQFLDLGPWAVNLALTLGIFPYVMKLLQSPDYKQTLVGIWARILAFDSSCQYEVVKDGALPHFVQHLTWGLNRATMNLPLNPVEAVEQRVMAAFILSATCDGYPQGQVACVRQNLHGTCCALLSSVEASPNLMLDPDHHTRTSLAEERVPPKFRLWLCLCLGNLFKDNVTTQAEGLASGVHLRLIARLQDDSPEVRSAACFTIACLLSVPPVPEAVPPLPVAPLVQPMQQTVPSFNGTASSPAAMQGNQLLPPQTLIPPPITGGGSGFAGRLQPNFVHPGGGTMAWQPQQIPVNVVHNPSQNPGQVLRGQSLQYDQNTPTNQLAGPGIMGDFPMHTRPQTNAQLNVARQQTQASNGDPLVFEDKRRLALDLLLSKAILEASSDASAMVRYEAVVVLARLIEKYLPAFLAVSEEMALIDEQKSDATNVMAVRDDDSGTVLFPFPVNVDREVAKEFRTIWRTLRRIHHDDVHPIVIRTAHSIICYVHENLLKSKPLSNRRGKSLSAATSSNSEHNLSRFLSPVRSPGSGDRVLHRAISQPDEGQPLRRISSEFGVSWLRTGSTSANSAEKLDTMTVPKETRTPDYSLPKSEFLAWKRDTFFSNERANDLFDSLDPLSPHGALKGYLWRRNTGTKELCAKIAEYYSCLAPKAPKTTKEILNAELFTQVDESALNIADEKLTKKKNTLELKQTGLLRNTSSSSTSMLRFHPYEDILVVCDDQSGISVWDSKRLAKEYSIHNGNLKGSRFTSTCWMNPESNSIFVAGCDDGSVRAWGNIPFSKTERNNVAPLMSAFYAIPNISPDKSMSGLILEWQQYSGQLLAAGNCDRIRSWDMHTEKCSHEMKTDSDACITTLTTAWKSDLFDDGMAMSSAYGAGPNLLVAGFSDGAIRVFDTRTQSAVVDVVSGLPGPSRSRRQRTSSYKEHESWVVEAAFTGYDKNYEIVSGSIEGDVRIFDLRASRSLQAYTVQRSPMTAMTVHGQIPLVATGSRSQVIKLMTLDGVSTQVIRHSQLNHGRMIGPIRCLAFHPYHTLLAAAGGDDNLVHLFAPKNPVDLSQ